MIEGTTLKPAFHRNPLSGIGKSLSGWAVILFAVVTLVFILAQIFQWTDLAQISPISDAIQAVISVAVVIMTWRTALHPSIDKATKRAWVLVALSYTSYSCGHCLWFYYSSVLGIEPFPSLADVGFLGFYPLMLVGIWAFPTKQHDRAEQKKFIMDTAIVMLGSAMVVWHFIIRPTIEKVTDNEWLTPLLNLSYTVGDMVLMLGIITILFRRPLEISRYPLLLIIAGLIGTSIADYGFAYLTLQGAYYSGHWIDNFFIVGMLAFLLASHYQYQILSAQTTETETQNTPEVTETQSFSWLPYLAVALGGGMLLLEAQEFWTQPLGVAIYVSLTLTGLVVARQITAVKENARLMTEHIARRSELRFRSLVQHSSDVITILDSEGTILYESPSVKNILGYETEDLIGRQVFEFIHPEDSAFVTKTLATLAKEPEAIVKHDVRFLHQNGSWRFLESIARLLDEQKHGVSGILVNTRDITERKKSENDLRSYTTKLQHTNRELQDFAFVASHDLQEPLRKIQTFGDRLKSRYSAELPQNGRESIDRMQAAANRMQGLLGDLLGFSQVFSKAQPFATVDLQKITKEAVSDLKIYIKELEAKILVDKLPEIEADAAQMRQLMRHLIDNALKFRHPERAPLIKIYSQTADKFINEPDETAGQLRTGFCRIFVEDNGIGFDEKYVRKIFTLFQRLHKTTDYEGSGVGLAICRKIVERHNGEITARSQPQQKATFIITLPIKQTGEDNFVETADSQIHLSSI